MLRPFALQVYQAALDVSEFGRFCLAHFAVTCVFRSLLFGVYSGRSKYPTCRVNVQIAGCRGLNYWIALERKGATVTGHHRVRHTQETPRYGGQLF